MVQLSKEYTKLVGQMRVNSVKYQILYFQVFSSSKYYLKKHFKIQLHLNLLLNNAKKFENVCPFSQTNWKIHEIPLFSPNFYFNNWNQISIFQSHFDLIYMCILLLQINLISKNIYISPLSSSRNKIYHLYGKEGAF